MNTVLFLTADYANQGEKGKLNVLGVFNRIYARTFPAKHRRLYIVIRISLERGEFETDHDFKVLFLDNDGAELGALIGTFKIAQPVNSGTGEADLILELNDLLLPKPGRYEFRLVVNKEVKSVIPLDVENLPEEKAE